MKAIYKLLLVIGGLFVFTSCSDFLKEEPKGRLFPETFFATQEELDMSIHALYKQVMLTGQQTTSFCLLWAADDITTHPSSNKQQFRIYDQFAGSADGDFQSIGWTSFWSVVKAANFIINNVERTPVTPDKIEQAEAQARYWRAYAYLFLVRMWGPVPMSTDATIDYNAPLASVEDIYKFIVEDLKYAETYLPLQWPGAPASMNGMNVFVSQAAAKATLAYAYMSMAGWPMNKTENYALAANKAKEVITDVQNGTYILSLLTNYSDIHSWAYNYRNPELLLGVYYNKAWGWDDNCMSSLCDIIAEAGGWGDSSGEIKFWMDFPDGARKDATYAPKTLRWDSDKALVDWWNANGDVKNPYFQKTAEGYNGAEWDYTKGGTETDWLGQKTHQIIRLSEVYCWYAEAVGRSGQNDALAYTVLNEVRTRAGLGSILSGSLTPNQLAEAAWNEHGWEIAGYYWGNIASRFFDMQRMNKLKDHFEYRKQNPTITVIPGVERKEAVPVTGEWSDNRMYAPYPASDQAMNPHLKR
jgi:hypothetical protein